MKTTWAIFRLIWFILLVSWLWEGFGNVFHGVRWLFGESTMATAEKRDYYESSVKLPGRLGGSRVPYTSSYQHYTYNVDGREYRGESPISLSANQRFEIRYSKAHPENSGVGVAAIRDGVSRIALGIVFYFGTALLLYFPIFILSKIRPVDAMSFKDFWFG